MERGNLGLLVSLEQDALGNTQEDGGEPIHTGYADIVSENQYRRLYLSKEELNVNEDTCFQVIDRGSHYEVANASILADTCYALSVMDGKGVGDTLCLGSAVYRITEAEALGFRDYTVTISDYLTQGDREVRSQFGLHSSGSLELWGGFNCDPSGLIVSYTEFFVP